MWLALTALNGRHLASHRDRLSIARPSSAGDGRRVETARFGSTQSRARDGSLGADVGVVVLERDSVGADAEHRDRGGLKLPHLLLQARNS